MPLLNCKIQSDKDFTSVYHLNIFLDKSINIWLKCRLTAWASQSKRRIIQTFLQKQRVSQSKVTGCSLKVNTACVPHGHTANQSINYSLLISSHYVCRVRPRSCQMAPGQDLLERVLQEEAWWEGENCWCNYSEMEDIQNGHQSPSVWSKDDHEKGGISTQNCTGGACQ